MRYARLVLILTFAFATIGVPNITKVLGQTSRPPEYYEDKGACPFECCAYREWKVLASTVFYKDRSTTSSIVFRSRRGDRVIGLTGTVITFKAGKALIKKKMTLCDGSGQNSVTVRPGDVLYLIHYVGEGYYKFWIRGKIYEGSMPFENQLYKDHSNDDIRLLREPDSVWWVKIKNRQGQIGWSKETDNFGNMDACG